MTHEELLTEIDWVIETAEESSIFFRYLKALRAVVEHCKISEFDEGIQKRQKEKILMIIEEQLK